MGQKTSKTSLYLQKENIQCICQEVFHKEQSIDGHRNLPYLSEIYNSDGCIYLLWTMRCHSQLHIYFNEGNIIPTTFISSKKKWKSLSKTLTLLSSVTLNLVTSIWKVAEFRGLLCRACLNVFCSNCESGLSSTCPANKHTARWEIKKYKAEITLFIQEADFTPGFLW